jgi:hypothetical protein
MSTHVTEYVCFTCEYAGSICVVAVEKGVCMTAVMAKKTTKPRAKPNRTGTARSIYFPDDIEAALQAFRESQRVPPTVTDTLMLALQEFLQKEGFYPPPPKTA